MANFLNSSFNARNLNIKDARKGHQHAWITVVDPTNQRSLLQACDDCGVVKSENSVIRNCKAPKGQALVSGAMSSAAQLAV